MTMTTNKSIVSLATLVILLSGGAATVTGVQYYQNSAQERFLLKAGYEAQASAMQALYLANQAGSDRSFASELEALEGAVDKAVDALRNGDPVQGIQPAPPSVLSALDVFQKTWSEVTPSIAQILSQRPITDEYTRQLGIGRRASADAVKSAGEAKQRLESVTPQLQAQLTAAFAVLEAANRAILDNSKEPGGATLEAFSRYVTLLINVGQQLPKDKRTLMDPLLSSYKSAEQVIRALQAATASSPDADEKISHAKSIWSSRDRLAASAASLVAAVSALPESRAISLTTVAILGGFALLLAIASMLTVRAIAAKRTSDVESIGRKQDASFSNKSLQLAQLLGEISQVESGRLRTQLIETNEATSQIAQALNKTFSRFAGILDDVKETIVGLSAATEQAVVTERNVVRSRKEQENAIQIIFKLFGELTRFIGQIETISHDAQQIAYEMGSKVSSGQEAVMQVHNLVLDLQGQINSIQHSSKHLIESLQVLENIATVVDGVAHKSNILSFNAQLIADELQDKGQSHRISAQATSMAGLSEDTRLAGANIVVQLRMMRDAATKNQQSVDHVQRETERLIERSNVAQDALVGIKSLGVTLTTGAERGITETKHLKDMSADVGSHIESVRQYSQENSAASEETAAAISHVNVQALELTAAINKFDTRG